MADGISGPEGLHQFDLDLHPNEASGLLIIENEELLAAHGWDLAFWVVLDEGSVDHCIALVGHRSDADGADLDGGWEIERLHAVPSFAGETKKTEDCEALSRKDGFVYVFGSHFGSKGGPLEPKRGFVARFRESDVLHATEDPAAEIRVSRPAFLLHRIINDAFREHGAGGLVPLGDGCREAFIEETVGIGEKKDKKWRGLVRSGDWPLNIEGATFRPDNGNLLVGLRFPTAADGKPLLVEVADVETLFDPDGGGRPEVRGLWTLDAVGREGKMAGVRDLTFVGDELHAVTGDLDSAGGKSVLLSDYPGGRDTIATHWRAKLPADQSSGHLEAEPVREFPGLPRVEGIAGTKEGRFFYVVDEDDGVHLRLTRFLTG